MKSFECFTSGLKNRGDTNSNGGFFLVLSSGRGLSHANGLTHPFDTPTQCGGEALWLWLFGMWPIVYCPFSMERGVGKRSVPTWHSFGS